MIDHGRIHDPSTIDHLWKIYLNSRVVTIKNLQKLRFICFNEITLNMIKNAFFFVLKPRFVLRYLNFCPNFFGHVGKSLDKKAEVNFKNYDVIYWETNSYNRYIAQHGKK